ncbi:MAG: hypothetical protein DWP97_14055 [Calditrichaeota bacterium]|nr:MAG: hypothetical protein DWP97_14055 [Calditrichota bacterium]
MYLTVSKKFEISFSHRLFIDNLSEIENTELFGDESKGKFGHGHNADVTFLFNGPISETDGMVINVVEIKEKINRLLAEKYDHKFLNFDNQSFKNIQPSFEMIAKQMFADARPLFEDSNAKLVVCHIIAEPDFEATAYKNGKIERSFQFGFSAARRTYSPHLSDEENEKMFGLASRKSGHGHHYRVRLTFSDKPDETTGITILHKTIEPVLKKINSKLDHKNISTDIPEFNNIPHTTEALTKKIYEILASQLPLERLRINEHDYFYIEYNKAGEMFMGIKTMFHAAHRLTSDRITEQENREIYGKCNNIKGHGHTYKVEVLLSGEYDEKTGTMYNLIEEEDKLKNCLDKYNYKHLNLETEEFKNLIPTGENIAVVLWEELQEVYEGKLERLSLWETPNNRFTIRKEIK